MLGNDVIDLEDVDARPMTFRPRFDERVFSDAERRAIARDPVPLACRWAHWGAKEAAYKLARQIDPDFIFSPIQLTPRFEPASSTQTNWIERRGSLTLPSPIKDFGPSRTSGLDIRSYETRESVHVIAMPRGSDWDALVFSIESIQSPASTGTDASRAVRALAVREIGRNLEIGLERLSIGQKGKIPTVELDGSRSSLALSLSHHGRFVAFAMASRKARDCLTHSDTSVRRAGVALRKLRRGESLSAREMIMTDRSTDWVGLKKQRRSRPGYE